MDTPVSMIEHSEQSNQAFLSLKRDFKDGMQFELGPGQVVTNYIKMDSKTLATIMVVFICVLLFPVFIGVVGGIFGVIGGIMGGIIGLIGGLFGVVIGAIGAVFGAIFGVIGWMFDEPFRGHWPIQPFSRDLVTVIVLVLIVVLFTRSRTRRAGK